MIERLLAIFGGGAGQAVGKLATFGGILVSLAPVALFVFKEKSTVLVEVTVGDAAFWGMIIAANLFVAFITRPGRVD